MSFESRYAAAMRARSDRAASTPEAAAARLRRQDALSRAREDFHRAYPRVTVENIDAAARYQQARIAYWCQELNA